MLYNGVIIQTQSGGFELFSAVVSVCGDTLAQVLHTVSVGMHLRGNAS